MGPGDNIGLCAAKSSATAIRGQYYSYAAAIGKVGAFVGTYVIPVVQKNAPNPTRAGQDPFFVSSSLCILAAFMAIFMMPEIGQVCAAANRVPCTMFMCSPFLRTPLPTKMPGSATTSRLTATIPHRWVPITTRATLATKSNLITALLRQTHTCSPFWAVVFQPTYLIPRTSSIRGNAHSVKQKRTYYS